MDRSVVDELGNRDVALSPAPLMQQCIEADGLRGTASATTGELADIDQIVRTVEALHQGARIARVVPQGPHLRATRQQEGKRALGFDAALLQLTRRRLTADRAH